MEFWNDQAVDEGWNVLIELAKKYEFIDNLNMGGLSPENLTTPFERLIHFHRLAQC